MLTTGSVSNGLLVLNDDGLVNDRLVVSSSGATLTVTDTEGSLTAGAGATQAGPASITVPLTSIPAGIEFRTGGGDDEIQLQSLDLAGGKLQIEGVERLDVSPGAVVEAAAGMTFTISESIDVGANAILSTRRVAGNPLTANSTGNSGPLTLEAPDVEIAAGGKLLAQVHAGSSHQPGSVTVHAENVVTSAEFLIQGETQKDPGATERTASISLAAGAVIRGGNVRLRAEAGDFTPDTLSPTEIKLFENLAVPAIGYATKEISLPALAMLKNASADVQLADDVEISSSADVVIDARANATAKMNVVSGAGLLGETPLSILSFVYTRADASAQALVGEDVSITAAGSVNVLAHSEAEANSTSRTTKNVGMRRPTNKDDLAVSTAISDVNNTSHATVGEGTTVTAGDHVYVHATGTSKNSASGESGIYEDGLVGTAVAWGTTDSDIQAIVNGSLVAAGKTVAPSFPLDVDTDVVTDGDGDEWIVLPAGHGLEVGDALLVAGAVHFVVRDAAHPSRVGLATSLRNAHEGMTVKVSDIYFGDEAPRIIPLNGIDIRGNLETTESSVAVTGVGGPVSGEEYIAKKELAYSLFDRNVFPGLKRDIQEKNYLGDVDIEFAAALAFINDANQVVARVGPTGELRSSKDVSVAANLTAKLQTSAESAINAPSDGELQTDAVSLAAVVGLYDNVAVAQVAGGAVVDVKRELTVQSDVAYPFITNPKEFITENDFVNLSGYAALFDKLGINSRLFNSWARSVAKSTEEQPTLVGPSEAATDPAKRDSEATGFGVSGSVSYLDYRNASQAQIGGGNLFHPWQAVGDDGSIRLGPAHNLATGDAVVYRSLDDDSLEGLADGQTYYVIVDSADPQRVQLATSAGNAQNGVALDVALGDATRMLHRLDPVQATATLINQDEAFQAAGQAVTVDADTSMKLISLNGIFDLEISQQSLNKLKQEKDPTAIYSPIGAEGKALGVGGAVYLFDLQSETEARITRDTRLDAASGLDVLSNTQILDVVLAQSGAQSESYGFAGTVTYISQATSSVATMEAGVQVQAGDLNVKAKDTTTQVNVGGSVLRGNHRGAGVTVAVNDIDRDVIALIGAQGPLPAESTDIDARDIQVEASADGNLYAVTLAAAVMTKNKPRDNPQDSSSLTGRATGATSSRGARSGDDGRQGKFGIGVSGDASVNTINDEVRAVIRTRGTIDGRNVEVAADNDTAMVALAGAVAINTNQQSAGIAGSFSQVALDGVTVASIEYATLAADKVTISSKRSSDLFSLAAGGAGAPSKSGTGVAGSVTWNDATDTTTAELANVTLILSGDLDVTAENTAEVKSIAGAAAFGGKVGLGAAVASNDLTATTRARVVDSMLQIGGGVDVTADNLSDVFTITAAGGVSTGVVGVGGTVAVNRVNNRTEATIVGATPRSDDVIDGAVNVLATGDNDMFTFAGAVGLGKTGGVGASVGYNDVRSTVRAAIEFSTLDTAGTLTVRALSPAIIDASAVSGGAARSAALGGSVTLNSIQNNAAAEIKRSELTASRVVLESTDGVVTSFNPRTAISNNVIDLGQDHGLQSGDVVVYGSGGEKAIDTRDAQNAVEPLRDGTYYVQVIDSRRIRLREEPNGRLLPLDASQTTGTRHLLSTSGIASSAGGIGLAKSAAFGAAVAINDIENTLATAISDSMVTATAGEIGQQATTNSLITAWSVGGAGAGSFALGGSVTKNDINNTITAEVKDNSQLAAAGDVSLIAVDHSGILVRGGGFALAGKAGIGAAVATNAIGNEIAARLDGSIVTAGGDVETRATASSSIDSVTIGGAGGASFALGGSVATNDLDNQVTAQFGRGTRVTADGTAVVAAHDQFDSYVFAGGFAVAGNVGAGAGVATLDTDNRVRAVVDEAVEVDVLGQGGGQVVNTGERNVSGTPLTRLARGLAVVATSWETIDTQAIGASVAGSAALGGSAVYNELREITEAAIRERATIASRFGAHQQQDVLVLASDQTDVMGLGGALAGGGAAGVGAGLDLGTFEKVTRAFLDASADVAANGDIEVHAFSDEEVVSIAGGIGAGGTVGLAGGASVYLVDVHTRAFIGWETEFRDQPELTFTHEAGARDTIERASGNWLADGFRAGQAITVTGSDGLNRFWQIYEVTGQVLTLAAHNDVSPLVNDTGSIAVTANRPQRASAIAQGNVNVNAVAHSEFDVFAGAFAGAGVAAIGGGAGVPVLNKTTEAYIGRSAYVEGFGRRGTDTVFDGTFQITHQNNSSSSTEVDPGDLDTNNEQGIVFDESLLKQRVSTAGSRSLKGVSVTAVNRDDLETFTISAGATAGVGVLLAADVHVVTNTTRAFVDHLAQVNGNSFFADSDQTVHVAAGNDFYRMGVAGTAAIAGLGTFTPGFDGVFVSNTTEAYFGVNARVNANQDVNVLATAREDILAVSAAAGASGGLSVAGAVALIDVDNQTLATIQPGVVIFADGNVLVRARDDTNTDIIAGAAGVGLGGGVGASVSTTIIDKQTEARVADFVVIHADADQAAPISTTLPDGGDLDDAFEVGQAKGLVVEAIATEDVFSLAGTGAGGLFAGVAGAASVELIDSDTAASIGDSAVNKDNATGSHQDVHVGAANSTTILAVGATAAIGAGALGGGVDVGKVHNDTTAVIDQGAEITAGGNVRVFAAGRRDIESITVSLAAGGLGFGGAVAVYSIAGNIDSTADDGDDGTRDVLNDRDGNGSAGGHVQGQVRPTELSKVLGKYNQGGVRRAQARMNASATRVNVDDSLDEQRNASATHAWIADNVVVDAGLDVEVAAKETIDFELFAGGGGIGGFGVGASVAVINVASDVRADIFDAQVSAGAVIRVGAELQETLEARSLAAAAAGVVAAAGAVVVATDDSYVQGAVGGDLTSGSGITVFGTTRMTRDVTTGGATLSLGLAAGAAVSRDTVRARTVAFVADGTQVGSPEGVGAPSMLVSSLSSIFAESESTAISAGIAAGAGNDAEITLTPQVSSFVGEHADIHVEYDMDVVAHSVTTAIADVGGLSIGGVAVGVSFAEATVLPTVTAEVRGGASIEAGNIYVNAVHNIASWRPPTGFLRYTSDNIAVTRANASPSAGSLVGGVGGKAVAFTHATVNATTGPRVRLKSGQDVLIEAYAAPKSEATIDKFSVGIVANIGSIEAIGASYITSKAEVGSNSDIDARNGSVAVNTYVIPSGDATSDGDGGGGVDVSTVFSVAGAAFDLDAHVGPGTKIKGNTIFVGASADESATSRADIGSLGAISVPTSEARALIGFVDTVTGDTEVDRHATADVTIGADAILDSSLSVYLSADSSPYSYTLANALGAGLASDVDAFSDNEIFADANVTLGERVQIGGKTSTDAETGTQPGVTLSSVSRAPRISANPWVASGGLFSDSDISLDLDYVLNNNITVPASAAITADTLLVQSDIRDPEMDVDPNSTDYSIPFGTNDIVTNVRFNRAVNFNADVNLMAEEARLSASEAEVTADNVLFREEADKFVITGTTLSNPQNTVTIKMPSIQTTLEGEATSDLVGGVSILSGAADVDFQSAPTLVHFYNSTSKALQIDSLAPDATAPLRTIVKELGGVVDVSTFTRTIDQFQGPKRLTVSNDGADTIFNTSIDTRGGSIAAYSSAGDFTVAPGVTLTGREVVISGNTGDVGTAENPLSVEITTLSPGDASDGLAAVTVSGSQVFASIGSRAPNGERFGTRAYIAAKESANVDFRPTKTTAGGTHSAGSKYRVDLFAPDAVVGAESLDLDVRSYFPDTATGWLTVDAENGDVAVSESMGDLRIHSIRGDDVVLFAPGKILGDAGRQGAHVEADNLQFDTFSELTTSGQGMFQVELPESGLIAGSASQSIRLEELTGDMLIERISTGSILGSITLVADGDLLWKDDSLYRVITGTLDLTGDSIGSPATPFPTQVSLVDLDGRDGLVSLKNLGGLNVGSAKGGQIDLEVVELPSAREDDPIWISVSGSVSATNDVVLSVADKTGTEDFIGASTGTQITSQEGEVRLTAGDHIQLQRATISANGPVTLVSRTAEVDGGIDAERVQITRAPGAGDRLDPSHEGFDINNLNLTGPLTIDGRGPDNTTGVFLGNVNVTGSSIYGVRVHDAQSVIFLDSTIRDSAGDGISLVNVPIVILGNLTAESNAGAGLSSVDSGLVFLLQSTINDNRNRGVYVKDTPFFATAVSTISGNSTNETSGGGILIDVDNGSEFDFQQIYNSTITQNRVDADGNQTAQSFGGGIHVLQGNVQLRSSIVAENYRGTGSQPADLAGLFTTDSVLNLIGVNKDFLGLPGQHNQFGTVSNPLDPRLEELAFNGGDTKTHALMRNSTAIDQGRNFLNAVIDQRGFTRTIDTVSSPDSTESDGTDIGAFEFIEGDFGDAPNSYGTLILDNGPFHLPFDGPFLGKLRDLEQEGIPSEDAEGDDQDNEADEDGITFFGNPHAGQIGAEVRVTVNGADEARLDAWIDFDQDGTWRSAGEQIAASLPLRAGENVVRFDVPVWAASGDTIGRFRISSEGGLTPYGTATMRVDDDEGNSRLIAGTDGEVEDLQLSIAGPTGSGVFAAETVGTLADSNSFPVIVPANLNRFSLDVLVGGESQLSRFFYNTFSDRYTDRELRIADLGVNGAGTLEVADLDRDGHQDIVAAAMTPFPRVVLLQKNGAATEYRTRTVRQYIQAATAVSTADMDGDGDLDIIAAFDNILGRSDVAWYENDAEIEPHLWTERFLYQEPAEESADAFPGDDVISLLTTDINGDGVPDVVLQQGNGIYWIDSTDERKTLNPVDLYGGTVFTYPSIALGDVDGDGDQDVVAAFFDHVTWYENEGNTNLAWDAQQISPSFSNIRPTVADLNGDGRTDVIAKRDDDLFVFEQQAGGNWSPVQIADPASVLLTQTAVGDVDGDGDLEIFAAYGAGFINGVDENPTIRMFRRVAVDVGDADATLANRVAHIAVGPTLGSQRDVDPLDQASGDAVQDDQLGPQDDEDGVFFASPVRVGQQKAEVVVVVETDSTAVLDAWIDFNGDGVFGGPGERIASAVQLDSGDHVIPFAVPADAEPGDQFARFRLTAAPEDGSPPVPAPPLGTLGSGEVEDHRVRILAPRQVFDWDYSAVDTDSMVVNTATAANLNGVIGPDLIVAGEGILWRTNLGNGNWGNLNTIVTPSVGTSYDALATVDLDQDGDQDVIAARSAPSARLTWFENQAASFTAHDLSVSEDSVASIVPTDFDQDGDWDLILTFTGASTVRLYTNDGSNNFTAAGFTANVTAAVHSEVGDLDGDGDLDVAVASLVDGVVWLENQNLQAVKHSLENGFFTRVAIADLNGDGSLDLAATSENGPARGTYWFENSGGRDPKFTSDTIEQDSTIPSDIFPADINGDGHPDLVRISASGDKQAIFYHDGNAVPGFTQSDITSGPAQSYNARTGLVVDFTQDGLPDLITVGTAGQVNRFLGGELGDAPFDNQGPPTATLAYVDDDYGPGTVAVTFSETVSGLDVDDFSLQRGSTPLDLSAAVLVKLTGHDFQLYLPATARRDGDYQLTLNAAGSGITDDGGVALVAGATETWNRTDFSVAFVPAIGPLVNSLPDVVVEFSGTPNGVEVSDLRLTVNDNQVDVTTLDFTAQSPTSYLLKLSELVSPEDGNYVLTLERVGSNILSGDGHPLTNSPTMAWTFDSSPPRAYLPYDLPDKPVSNPPTLLDVRFQEPIRGFLTRDNLRITRDGEVLDLGLVGIEQETFQAFEVYIGNVVQESGTYEVTIGPATGNDFLTDLAGNPMVTPFVGTFVVDRVAPVADIQPPAGGENQATVLFAEAVLHVDVSDFRLSRDGQTLDLADDALAAVSDREYTLSLPESAGSSGVYTLSVFPNVADITDIAGNPFREASSASWTVDVQAPTVEVLDVVPDMREISVGLVTFEFSEPVDGFEISDVRLFRGDDPVVIGHLPFQQLSPTRYGIDLSRVTTISGDYRITLQVDGSGIMDASGNGLQEADEESFSIQFVDGDADSVGDVIESRAPNEGDGNNDNTPDSQQANVASLPAPQDGTFVTIAVGQDETLNGVRIVEELGAGGAPQDVDFRLGFLDYDVTGVPVGGSTVVTIYLEDGTRLNNYYKYGPTSANSSPHWYRFNYDDSTGTGAKFFADRIELHLVDGARGDDDLTANGVIVDPGAPASDLRETPWTNPFDRGDIDEDGQVTNLDLEMLRSELAENGPRDLPVTVLPGVVDRFWDVTGDNRLSAEDIWVLSFLLFEQNPVDGELIVTTAVDAPPTAVYDPTAASLRQALELANTTPGHQRIVVDSSLAGQVMHLPLGQLEIRDDVTLVGQGSGDTVVSARPDATTTAGSRVLAIEVVDRAIDVTLSQLTITDGKTGPAHGAGIYFDSPGTLTIAGAAVVGNHAEAASGGGIYAAQGALIVSDSNIDGNTSSQDGGGIASFGEVTVSNSRLRGNSAFGFGSGGGIFNRDGSVEVIDSEISSNSAGYEGGGIRLFNLNAEVLVVGSTLTNNSADYGGGISSDNVTVVGSTIHGNRADVRGGGVFAYDGTLNVFNSTLSGNRADGDGGGIWGLIGITTLANSTITENHAEGSGGGIFAPPTLVLRNTILAGNTSVNSAPDLSASTVDARHSLIGDNSGSPLAESQSVHPSTGNLIGDAGSLGVIDPRLEPLADNGGKVPTHALRPDSLALDAGDDNAIPLDVADVDGDEDRTEAVPFDSRGPGFARRLDADVNGSTTVDMGAFEQMSTVSQRVELALSAAAVPEAGGVTTVTAFLVDQLGQPVQAGPQGVSVTLRFAGSASIGADYSVSGSEVLIPAGADRATVVLTAQDDALAEGNETISVEVDQVTNAGVGAVSAVTATVVDDDASPQTMARLTFAVTDVYGHPLPGNQVVVGQDFRLIAYAEDTRDQPQGVFAGYLDVAYPDRAAFTVHTSEYLRLELPFDTTGGSFELTMGGVATAGIPVGATPEETATSLLQTLEDHPQIGAGNVRLEPIADSAGAHAEFVFHIAFQNDLAGVDLPAVTIDASQLVTATGGTQATIELLANGGGTFEEAFVPGRTMGNGALSAVDVANEFQQAGSFCYSIPCGFEDPSDPVLLWSVDLRAEQPGSIEFVANPPDNQIAFGMVLLGRDTAVPADAVVFGAAQVHVTGRAALDYGDAPDPTYRTTFAREGARHQVGTLHLGATVDAELDGQPTANAEGDGSDDDGVFWAASLLTDDVVATTSHVVVTSSGAGLLDAWIDFNQDGNWNGPGEQIATGFAVDAGANVVGFTIPAGAVAGQTVARFRLSSAGGLQPVGYAADGEVEDYVVTVVRAENVTADVALPFPGEATVTAEDGSIRVRVGTVELLRVPGAGVQRLRLTGTGGDDAIQIGDLAAGMFDGELNLETGGGDDSAAFAGGDQFDLADGSPELVGVETIDFRNSLGNGLTLSPDAVRLLVDSSEQLLVLSDRQDSVELSGEWSLLAPQIIDGRFTRVVESSDGGELVVLHLYGPNHWRNPVTPLDVNNNGLLADPVGDILPLINEANRQRVIDELGHLPVEPTTTSGFLNYDVNGDFLLTPIDILILINYRNAQAEGEAAPVSEPSLLPSSLPAWNWQPVDASMAVPPFTTLRPQTEESLAAHGAAFASWTPVPNHESPRRQSPTHDDGLVDKRSLSLEDWIADVDRFWDSELGG